MTAPQADGADRISGAAKSLLRPSTALPGLAILLLVGLVIRLTLAYVLLPGSGFESDIGTFTAWALRLAEQGPGSFYATAGFADYPPGYLYVLWLIGGLGHLLAPLGNTDPASATGALIKLPAIFGDLLVGFLLYRIVRSWRAPRLDAHRVGLIAAGLYLFNPVTWYDSAIWGQTDAFGALITLVTVAALVRGNSEGASALALLAALIKPQFGIVLLPIVGIVLLRRHLLRPGSGPRNPVLAPNGFRSWFESEQGPWRLVSSATVSLLLLLVLLVPFSLDIFGFIGQMQKTAGGYPYLSVNAYNPWALIASGGRDPLAFGGGWSEDTVRLVGPLPGVVIGGVLLALGFAIGVARAAWRDDRRTILIVTVFLALAFYMLPTRVHERYMFPIFGLLPLLAAVDRRWLWATVALSAAAFINFHGILTTELYATPNLERLPFGDLFRQPVGILASIGLHFAGFAFICWQMRPGAADERDPYAARTRVQSQPASRPQAAPSPEPAVPGHVPAASSALAVGIDPQAEPSDAPDDEPQQTGLLQPLAGTFAAVARWLERPQSIRRDRSALLVGESGGRLDRRDVLFLVLVFASSLLLRTYRLEVPYSMHFDEVYHARTATEFLQDWKYDLPHSIYEFTHPHMAKYLMAVGIVTLGNNRVVDVRDLGTNVKAAAVEQRWSPTSAPNDRNGDRLYVVTESEVRAYDLATRAEVARIPGVFDTVAVDEVAHVVFLGTASGAISEVNTGQIDDIVPSGSPTEVAAQPLIQVSDLDGDLTRLSVASDRLVAVTSTGTIIGLDLVSGVEAGRTIYPDPTSVVGVRARAKVMVDPASVTDAVALAETLEGLIDRDAFGLQRAIESATFPVPVAGYISKSAAAAVNEEIEAGNLPGVSVEDGTGLAIGLSTGVVLIDVETFRELAFFGTFAPVTGLALVGAGVEHPTVYAAAGDKMVTVILPSDDNARIAQTIQMPNTIEQVFWNAATTNVHILGRSQDGSAPTVYVVEPRSNSVFADAQLQSEPRAVVLDVQSERPAEDRDDLLALDGAGQLATVDIGNNQFAYRFPGVLLGALMAVCIYLLARFLFKRRSVALIVWVLVLADGMFFANSRIAMNDTYVAFFIVAAFTLFVPLWLGRWRGRLQIATALAGVGLLLGLALASKWVGAYAIGGLGLLILFRSALGRVLALLAMVALTALLGYIAITPNPDVASPQLNYPFLAMMLGLTVLLAVATALRPIRMTREELRLAVLAPIVPGLALLAFGLYRLMTGPLATAGQTLTPTRLIMFGGVLVALGVAVLGVCWVAGRYGYGPMAPLHRINPDREPAAPPAERGWLRPGSGFLGLSWILGLAAITVIPLVVYVLHYIPWINMGNQWFAGYPAGNTGQTLLDLQKSMYDYHNYLRATHAASSPWWAWPFDLKPVWFEQNDYAGGTTAVIYDTGNLVLFWLAIPAVLWMAYMAWKRRSLALTLVAIGIASLWLPWARIDRATFQYHIFTTLPFSFLALAYFLAELWHGPSKRTWALARTAAALAIIGAPLLWILRLPLCGIARTEQVNPGTEVCANLSRQLVLTDIQMIGVLLALGGLIAAIVMYVSSRSSPVVATGRSLLVPALFGVALVGLTIIVVGAGIPGQPVFQTQVQAEWPALAALLLLLIPAYFVLRATDPRRFVLGALGAAAIWFVTFYPNIASLPVPTPLSQIHLGLLPTWNWGFQFGVNLDEPNRATPDAMGVGLLAVAVVGLCLAAIYAARAWRAARVEDPSISPLPEAG